MDRSKYLLLVAFVLTAFAACQKSTNQNTANELSVDDGAIAALKAQSPLTVGCHSNLVSGSKGGEILYKNGSKITVPANAFETMVRTSCGRRCGSPVHRVHLSITDHSGRSSHDIYGRRGRWNFLKAQECLRLLLIKERHL